MSSPPPPSIASMTPHPTALAFFRQLDEATTTTTTTPTTTSDNEKQQRAPSSSSSSSSTIVKRTSLVLGWRHRHIQSPTYPLTIQSISYSVTQIKSGNSFETYGTGAAVWPASIVLLKYLEKQQQRRQQHAQRYLKGRCVLDLGAGTGITSIGVDVLGASLVVCTDGSEGVVRLARDNVERYRRERWQRRRRQGGGCRDDGTDDGAGGGGGDRDDDDDGGDVRVRRYQWGDVDESRSLLSELRSSPNDDTSQTTTTTTTTTTPPSFYDIILVSDCVLPKLYPIEPLVDALDQLSGPQTVIYLSYEHRYYPAYDPRAKFRSLVEGKGFELRVVPGEEHDGIYSVDDIDIWEVTRRRK